MAIREATPGDIAAMLELAATKRAEHGRYQPVFWRAAASARAMQELWFQFLLTSDDHRVLVADQDGDGSPGAVQAFLVVQVTDAPPVYDPGGRTAMVDDFVAEPGAVFDDLLAAARSWARDQGAVQLVVVTAAADEPKRSALAVNHFGLASEWWVGPVEV